VYYVQRKFSVSDATPLSQNLKTTLAFIDLELKCITWDRTASKVTGYEAGQPTFDSGRSNFMYI
jgi:hypothetical protein